MENVISTREGRIEWRHSLGGTLLSEVNLEEIRESITARCSYGASVRCKGGSHNRLQDNQEWAINSEDMQEIVLFSYSRLPRKTLICKVGVGRAQNSSQESQFIVKVNE